MMKSGSGNFGWKFLLSVVGVYILFALFNKDFLMPALKLFFSIIIKIIPILFLVFAIMFIVNYFITPKKLVSHLERGKGIKRWAITIVAGIISTGPIYLWYPLLSELKEHGIENGLIATFLYARAIKPALMPLMILYFGIIFTVAFTVAILIFSVLQGIVLQKIMGATQK